MLRVHSWGGPEIKLAVEARGILYVNDPTNFALLLSDATINNLTFVFILTEGLQNMILTRRLIERWLKAGCQHVLYMYPCMYFLFNSYVCRS